jgi:hypothetical protein
MMLALAMLVAMPDSDPLAPARQGLVQCRAPNEDRKTCVTIVAYTPQGKGAYRSVSRTRVRNQPEIIIEAVATVHVANGLVCDRDFVGTWRAARLTMGVGGSPAPEVISADVHRQLDPSFARFEGKLICSRYEPADHGVTSSLLIDGQPDPEDEGGLILWVKPDEYRLAPVPGGTVKKR